MEELEISQGTGGLDRRSFIQKSALVGGMVWAAPLVSSFGSPAFAGTLIIINGKTPGPCGEISNIAFVLKNDALRYKYERENSSAVIDLGPGTEPCVSCAPGTTLVDDPVVGWGVAGNGSEDLVTVTFSDGNKTALICPDDEYYVAWAVVFRGTGECEGPACLYFEGQVNAKGACLQVSNNDDDADVVWPGPC